MSLGTILLIVLILVLIGALPNLEQSDYADLTRAMNDALATAKLNNVQPERMTP